MGTIRLVVNNELREVLDFLRLSKYPTLTDAELMKVAISGEMVRAKRTNIKSVYDDSELGLKDLAIQAAKSFEMENDGNEQVFWNEKNLKPLNLKNYV